MHIKLNNWKYLIPFEKLLTIGLEMSSIVYFLLSVVLRNVLQNNFIY